jgi:carboxymethylenebutenolidase
MPPETVPQPAGTVGFAPAAGPVQPTAIITNSDGLETSDVRIPTALGDLPVYVAAPAGTGPHPIVLVVHEIFGVHEYVRDVARRFAKQGYFALAPELFFRGGDLSKAADIAGAMREIAAKVSDTEVFADLDRVLRWARENGGDAGRIGITGFCWGGRITWLYAAYNPYIKAGGAWYGRLAGEATANTPRFPIDVATELTVPVLGLYGGVDQGIPRDSVEKMRGALSSGKSASEIVLYEDAPHAFHADYRQSYREAAAKDGWHRLLAWFHTHGL